MKYRVHIVLTALTLFVSANGRAGAAMDSAAVLRAELQLLAASWLQAYNSGDSAALAGMYLPDAQYISGHVQGLIAAGRDRLIANFRKGVLMGGHIDAVTLLSVETSCDLAALLCSYEATNNGQKASGRNLIVARKVGPRWLIILHMTAV